MRGTGGALPDRQLRRRGREALARLFDAAEEVFADQGYHAARIEDVVARSGMARTTFYEYFAGKDDLFAAMVADIAAAMRDHAATLGPIRRGARGRAALRTWLDGFLGLYAEHAPLLRIWTEAEVADTGLGSLGTELLAEVSGRMAEAVRAGAGADVDPEVAGLAFVAMVERVGYYAAAGLLEADRSSLVDTLTDVIHTALF